MYGTTTIEGNLTRDPQLRRSPDGTAHLTFGVMVDRSIRTATGWEPAEPTYHWVKAFGPLAENTARSLSKGALVIVAGTVQTESYRSGEQRKTFTYVLAQAIGPSLRHAIARPQRAAQANLAQPQPQPQPQPPAATTPLAAPPSPVAPPVVPAEQPQPAPAATAAVGTPDQIRLRSAAPGSPA